MRNYALRRIHMKKPLILIDLDGVLNNYDGKYQENYIPELKSGAREFVQKLHNLYKIKIFTTRKKELVEPWLIKNDLKNYIDDVVNVKEPAFISIDDRSLTYRGNFDETLKEVENFIPYWKSEQNHNG